MTDKETELTTKFLDPGFKSPFNITLQQILDILHMDNRKEETAGTVESSRLIIENYNGPEGIANLLKTNNETGIKWSSEEKTDREQAFGLNSFPPPHIKTLWELIMENFEDQINQILLGAAIVSIIIGLVQHGWPKGMLEGTSIMIALCIIIIVSSGNNWASEQRLGKLVAQADEQDVYVYRKGNSEDTEKIGYENLVVGDLILIEAGMKVPADCMLVSGQNVTCKEDALTGEPDLLEKTPINQENYNKSKNCVMFAKATVSSGFGKALVVCVGCNTESGRIMKRIQEDNEDGDKLTLLQKKLNKIADQIGKVGYGCAIATFIVICIRLFCEGMGWIPCGCQNLITCEQPFVQQCQIDAKTAGTALPADCIPTCKPLDFGDINSRVYTELLNTIIIAITVIVVAIPEGLPLAVTISLSFSSAKMQAENNLVRQLASAETMGSVTHICSDKTGTLTQNIMTTMAAMMHQTSYRMKSEDKIDTQQLSADVKNGIGEEAWNTMAEAAIWNSSAKIEKPADDDEGFTGTAKPELEYQGNVTEVGIYKFFAGIMEITGVRSFKKSLTEDKILCVVPFESSRKRGSIVVQRDDGSVRVYTKGAPDVLFGKNPQQLASYTNQVKQENPTMTEEQASARASKQAGHNVPSMVKYALTANGVEDWYAPSTITNINSLEEVREQGGNSTVDHEDVFKATVKDFARQAYRTIMICYRDMSMDEFEALKSDNNNFENESDRDVLEQELIAIAIFGIQDPLRSSIVDSVETVKKAGIKVIMCTGDNIDTATAISKNAKIITDEEIAASEKPDWVCMEGKDFRATVGVLKKVPVDPQEIPAEGKERKMMNVVGNQGVFNRVIKHLRVLARSSPEDKLLLVTGLQASPYENEEEIDVEAPGAPTNYCSVAVTGDGTNDAPALSKANVGFAMGITGTDVAKGACDIILLDDNFASIITALKYGRNIYDNVRKFLQFQLTVNVVAMFIVFFGSVFLKDSPLTAVQMLWVNLIMDTLAALALATEPPDYNILERMPQPSSKQIVTELMWRNVYGHAIYQMVVLITILFAAQGWLVEKYDVKCLEKTDPSTHECLSGGLNPFYAANHYIELDTEIYWKKTKKTPEGKAYNFAEFQDAAWYRFQCSNLHAVYGSTEITKLLTTPGQQQCNKETYANLIATLYVNEDLAKQAKKVTDLSTEIVGAEGKATQRFFTPQQQALGAGTQKLLHMTYVFQIFVFMQVFNQINARILTESFNIFGGILRNWLFSFVMVSTFVVQMAMVEVGGKVTKTWPLEMYQNGICLLFGCGELFWGVFIKFLPVKFFQCFNFEEKPMTQEEVANSMMGSLKKGSSVAKKKKVMQDAVGNTLKDMVKEQQKRNEY